jgi:hypothetical protein
LNDKKVLPLQIANFDEVSLMVKNISKRKVYVPVEMKDAGYMVPQIITSIKFTINPEIFNNFTGAFQIKFFF